MNQAYQHLKEGTEHYNFIKENIVSLINRWNAVHTKSQSIPDAVIKEFKSVIYYNHNITIDDIKPAIDRGMMGQFGENYILDAQTFYRWFTGLMKQKVNERIKGAEAYKVSNVPDITEEQKQANRQATRTELIEVFMKYYNFYMEHGEVDGNIKRYYVVFWDWFRKLGLIDISEDEESRMNEVEAKHLRDLRSKLSTPELSQSKYKKFIEIFKSLEGLGIEDQLKAIKL
jgi:hypothetical protein